MTAERLTEIRDRLKEISALGSPTDEPDANGSVHSQMNWWKDQCDDVNNKWADALEELAEWRSLAVWGGTPEHIDSFIRGQQARIRAAQDMEMEIERLTRELDAAKSETSRLNAFIAGPVAKLACYAGSVCTDRRDKTREYAMQTVDWCEGLLEYAEKATQHGRAE